jgi:alkylation response protein AidB-like acyl-CoA dehydrogenase
MRFDLDDDTKLLQRTVREFATGELAPIAGELDRTKSFPYDAAPRWGRWGGWAFRFQRRSVALAARRCSTRSPSRS